jgi:hypothetical protein
VAAAAAWACVVFGTTLCLSSKPEPFPAVKCEHESKPRPVDPCAVACQLRQHDTCLPLPSLDKVWFGLTIISTTLLASSREEESLSACEHTQSNQTAACRPPYCSAAGPCRLLHRAAAMSGVPGQCGSQQSLRSSANGPSSP